MSKNGVSVVETVGKSQAEVEARANEQIAARVSAKQDGNAAASEGDAHLLVELTEESYKMLREVVDRATARGLDSSFDHWLADAIKSGTTARLRTWDDRDGTRLLKQAASGNANAIAQLMKIIERSKVGTNPSL